MRALQNIGIWIGTVALVVTCLFSWETNALAKFPTITYIENIYIAETMTAATGMGQMRPLNSCNKNLQKGTCESCPNTLPKMNQSPRTGCGCARCTGTHQNVLGGTYRHWYYRPYQPVRNTVRFFHNVRPVRRFFGRILFGG